MSVTPRGWSSRTVRSRWARGSFGLSLADYNWSLATWEAEPEAESDTGIAVMIIVTGVGALLVIGAVYVVRTRAGIREYRADGTD